MIYEESLIELMDLLTSEKRNVDLGQSILKYLETQKRYYVRSTNILGEHKKNIAALDQWNQNLIHQFDFNSESRKEPIIIKKSEESKHAWKRLAKVNKNTIFEIKIITFYTFRLFQDQMDMFFLFF